MEQIVDQIAKQMREVLSNQNTVVIMGVTPGNLGEWHNLGDPRLVCWTGDEAKSRTLPKKAKLVLTTRFVTHMDLARMQNALSSDGVLHTAPLSTGMLKKILELGYVEPKKNGTSDQPTAKTLVVASPVPEQVLSELLLMLPDTGRALEAILKQLTEGKQATSTIASLRDELQMFEAENTRLTEANKALERRVSSAEEAAQVEARRATKAEQTLAEYKKAAAAFAATVGVPN